MHARVGGFAAIFSRSCFQRIHDRLLQTFCYLGRYFMGDETCIDTLGDETCIVCDSRKGTFAFYERSSLH